MEEIKQSLSQLFRNNADKKSIYECGNMITTIQSMTEEKFIEIVSYLLINSITCRIEKEIESILPEIKNIAKNTNHETCM
jgi:hypothetical protein